MKNTNTASSFISELSWVIAPIAIAIVVSVQFRGAFVTAQSEQTAELASRDYDYESQVINFDLQKTNIESQHETKQYEANNLTAASIGELDPMSQLKIESSKYNVKVATENPFEDVLEDTHIGTSYMPESPAAQIERRVAKRQWMDDFEKAELQMLAKKVKQEGEAKGLAIEINKNFEIVSVKPIPKAGLGTLRLTQSGR
jgi:hypothetical protein